MRFNYKKAVQALNYLSHEEGGEMNKMKAIKLIWLADRLHLRKYGRTITGDIYFALKHGPVPSTTRDLLELNSFSLSDDEFAYMDEYLIITGKYDYKTNKAVNKSVFSKTDLECIEEVVKCYGKFDQWALRDISHKFPEWKRWEAQINKNGSRYLMMFSDFFNEDEGNNPLFNDDKENLELVQTLFQRSDIKDMVNA